MNDTKQLTIDFLYLDLSVCERCQAADKVLDEALSDTRGMLPSRVTVNKFQVSKNEVDESLRIHVVVFTNIGAGNTPLFQRK